MQDLLLNDQSEHQLISLANDAPHALLITGPDGIGKFTVAEKWAHLITPYVETLQPDQKGTITIDLVRDLYKHTRSKRQDHQVVIVDHAEAMSIDAQNAFLKLLEEPRGGVTFVLTAPHLDALLPTITSRTQNLQLHGIEPNKLGKWGRELKPGISDQELVQLLFVAQGRPAMLKRLLLEDGDFAKHKQIMQVAKRLLAANRYERLTSINDLLKDKSVLISTLEAMAQMTKLQIQKNSESKWLKLAEGLQDCLQRLSQNANPRAQLLRLFMLY